MTPPRGILDAWGGGTIHAQLPGGHRNSVWRVEVNGRHHVLKSTRHQEPFLVWLADIHARADRTGFRVPFLIRARNGHFAPGGWTLEPFLQGSPAPTPLCILPTIRRFHLATRGARPCPPATNSQPQLPKPVRPHPAPAGKSVIIHGDLNPSNILMAEGAPPALVDWDEARHGSPDLDLAALGAPVPADVSRRALVSEIASCWHPEPARARRLLYRLSAW